ncbi:MAG: hypothetical protein ABSC93_05525 [Bryobacteraceae bacterium]|jgi:hypothetical protein
MPYRFLREEDNHLSHLLGRQVFGCGNFAGRVSKRVNGVGVGHAAVVQMFLETD